MNLKVTTLKVSVHQAGESPVFGEQATHISIDDEAAGAFIVLEQFHHEVGKGMLRFDLEELELVTAEARKLIQAQKGEA